MKTGTISQRLTSSLLAVLILFLVVSLSVSYIITKHKTAKHIENQTDEMISSLTTVLQNPMWQLDATTASYIGQSFLENEMISHIEIADRRGNKYFSQGDTLNTYLTKTGNVIQNSMTLGTVTIQVNREQFRHQSANVLLIVGLTIAGIVFAIAAITGTLLRYLLRQPLQQLSKVTEDISLGKHSAVAEVKTIYKEFHPFLLTVQQMSTIIDEQMNELRTAELKYHRLVDNLTSGFLFRYGTDGQFSYVSASVQSVLGHSVSVFKLRNFSYYLTDNPLNDIHISNTEATQSGERTEAYEVEIAHSDGSNRWLEINEIPVTDEKTGSTVVEGIAYDITLRKEMELRKTTLNKELENRVAERTKELELLNKNLIEVKDEAIRANNAKSTFLANMSHELRTPLNAILGMSQLMETDKDLPKNFLSDIQLINRSGSYLLTLINEVLEISKIESGSIENNRESSDIRAAIEHPIELLRPRARDKGLVLTSTIDDSIPARICIDRRKVQQIILNLVGNSIKFTESGSVQCDIRLDKPHILELTISDTGPGISEDEQRQLFTPFVQTTTGVQSNQGTGLGLYITKQFAQLMGGDIVVNSILNKGSSFIVTLEFDDVADESMPDEQKSLIYHLPENSKPPVVLIVDDDFSNRVILSRTLEHAGCIVHLAKDGDEALLQYTDITPDLIWMDIQMPGKDGFEVTTAIRKMEIESEVIKNTSIIALTASAFKSDKEKILSSGCDGFIRKPFNRDEVFRTMESALNISFERFELTFDSTSKVSNTKHSQDTENARIYVLDDNPVNLKIISKMLLRSGYQPEIFTRVIEFENRLIEHVPNLVFLDLQLNNESGLNVLERMKNSSHTAAVPVAIISASDADTDKRQALSIGATSYLMKPYLMNEIISFVENNI